MRCAEISRAGVGMPRHHLRKNDGKRRSLARERVDRDRAAESLSDQIVSDIETQSAAACTAAAQ